VFSPRLLTVRQRSAELRRNLVAKLKTKKRRNGPIGSIPSLRIEHGGHSGRETPDPFPNSEDKPASVLHCTQVREPSGNADRCHVHLTIIL
jgi:hypothetical protein